MLRLATASAMKLGAAALGDRRTISLLAPLVGFAILGFRFHGRSFPFSVRMRAILREEVLWRGLASKSTQVCCPRKT